MCWKCRAETGRGLLELGSPSVPRWAWGRGGALCLAVTTPRRRAQARPTEGDRKSTEGTIHDRAKERGLKRKETRNKRSRRETSRLHLLVGDGGRNVSIGGVGRTTGAYSRLPGV
jgi:hypothetical protein